VDFAQAGCVADRLRLALPTVEAWFAKLHTWDEADFGRYETARYAPATDTFERYEGLQYAPSQLYRFTLEHSGRSLVTLAIRDTETDLWHCGDYYGLRFLTRSRQCGCHAMFKEAEQHLIIPRTDRWPMPYERAIVLASGLLPQRIRTDEGHAFLVFDQLTATFAQQMCELLGVGLEMQ